MKKKIEVFDSKVIEASELVKGGMRKRRPKLRPVMPDPTFGTE